MKKIKFLALCAIVAGVVTSCQKNEIANEVQPEAIEQLTKSQILALEAGGLSASNAVITTQTHLDGVAVKGIQVNDIFVAMNQLEDIALAVSDDGTKQYRTRNLVTGSNRTIDILGYTGSGNALTSTMQTGLQWAVNNYNRINSSLNFRLTFGTNFQAADMVVYNNNQGGGGGSAGFPDGQGRPNKFIQINAGTSSFGNNVNEHVIGHEIGHSIGLRHTNYARRNCPDGSNEGDGGVGAIHIPGTPTANQAGQAGLDNDSLMIACFSGNEDGEFSRFDTIALEFLY